MHLLFPFLFLLFLLRPRPTTGPSPNRTCPLPPPGELPSRARPLPTPGPSPRRPRPLARNE